MLEAECGQIWYFLYKNQRILKKGLHKYSRQNLIHTTNKSKLFNVGNPDRKEIVIMLQIIYFM